MDADKNKSGNILDTLRQQHEKNLRDRQGTQQGDAAQSSSSSSSSSAMVDAPEAAAAASSPPDRSSLVERDEKGEIVIPKIEIHSAELANAMRSQRGEFVGGCKLKTETIAVHGDLLQSELQQLQDERKTLKDATELARDRQAELAQLQAKLAQLKATLAEPPPPLASTESLKAELAKQQQKLTKTHGKIEDRKSKLAQRQEEIKQETHKLFKAQQDYAAKARMPTSTLHQQLLELQDNCKRLSDSNESIHSQTMVDFEFLEGCKHKDLSCVKCGNKILHDGLTDIIYWQVSMPQPQAK